MITVATIEIPILYPNGSTLLVEPKQQDRITISLSVLDNWQERKVRFCQSKQT